MRQRDWRRAQREKRTKPAYNRAVKDYEDDVRTAAVNRWWHVPRWQDKLRRFMRNEGVSRHQWPLYKKRCSECYRKPGAGCCEWCLSSRLRSANRQHDAMDYDKRLLGYSDPEEPPYDSFDEMNQYLWEDFLFTDWMQDYYQNDAPLTTGRHSFAFREGTMTPAFLAGCLLVAVCLLWAITGRRRRKG